MAGTCAACGATAAGQCRYCDRAVCADHERPSAHRCSGPRTAPPADATPAPTGAGGVDPIWTGALILLATLLVAVAVIGGVSLSPATDGADGPDEAQVARHVHELVNEERRERGVDALAWNETLARVAGDHSERMAREGYFGHGPEPLFERYDRYGLTCPGGENIYATAAVGGPGSERALARRTVNAWLASPGHRETLLKERFATEGVGVAVARDDGRATVYVTENFC